LRFVWPVLDMALQHPVFEILFLEYGLGQIEQ